MSRESALPSISVIGLHLANSMASFVYSPEQTTMPPDAPSAVITPNSSRTVVTPTLLDFQFLHCTRVRLPSLLSTRSIPPSAPPPRFSCTEYPCRRYASLTRYSKSFQAKSPASARCRKGCTWVKIRCKYPDLMDQFWAQINNRFAFRKFNGLICVFSRADDNPSSGTIGSWPAGG